MLQVDLAGSSLIWAKGGEAQAWLIDLIRRATSLADSRDNLWRASSESHGDGLRKCFFDAEDAANCALSLRHFFLDPSLVRGPVPQELPPRISLHFGKVFARGELSEGPGFAIAAAVEQKVPPGQIWATEAFRAQCSADAAGFTLAYVGEINVPKAGMQRIYRVMSGHHRERMLRSRPVDEVELTLELLESAAEEDRAVAIDSLARMSDARARDALLRVAEDSGAAYRLRRLALLGLEPQASPEISPRLLHLAESAELHVKLRRVALQVLGSTKDETVRPQLDDLLGGRASEGVREEILVAMRSLPGDETSAGILAGFMVRHKGDQMALEAAIVSAVSVPLVDALAESLLACIDPERYSITVCCAALESLLQHYSRPELATDLIKYIRDDGVHIDVRSLALDYVAQAGTRESLGVVEEIASRIGDPLRARAVAALVSSRSAIPRGVTRGLRVVSHSDEIIRRRTESSGENSRSA